jgi:hypothetical protein
VTSSGMRGADSGICAETITLITGMSKCLPAVCVISYVSEFNVGGLIGGLRGSWS